MLAVLSIVGNILFSTGAAQAAGPICTVNGAGGADYTTISAAIADLGCTTINVATGTYTGQIKITQSSLVVQSTSGAAVTIINGEGAAPGLVVICGNGNTFKGFTVDISANTGGSHSHEEKAIRVTGDSNVVQENIVVGRNASPASVRNTDFGIGIAATPSSGIGGCAANAVADGNQILNNEVKFWGNQGILIGGSDKSDGTPIKGNIAHHNWTGIYNDRATNTDIRENSVHDNNANGIVIDGHALSGRPVAGTVIEMNDVFNNGAATQFSTPTAFQDGILFAGAAGVTASSNCIHDNTATSGSAAGILVFDGLDGTLGDPIINSNNISNNDIGLQAGGVLPHSPTVNAENNWWGAADGPSGVGSGSGDSIVIVSGGVDFTPFLTSLASGTPCTPPDSDGDGVPDNLDQCPASILTPTVVIGSCNSGVSNTLFSNGCTISDLIAGCAQGPTNHGKFVSCVAHLTNDLKGAGTITGGQKGAIQSCAARALIP
jgi:parallel beta-helix repeat protein